MGSPSSERNSTMIDTSEDLKSYEEGAEVSNIIKNRILRAWESSASKDNNTESWIINSSEPVEPNSDDDNDINSKTEGARGAYIPNDFVDEQSLKDREVTLSESEKQTLKNIAETRRRVGNYLHAIGRHVQAVIYYTRGIKSCPLAYAEERSILYVKRAAAKWKCMGTESSISDCTKAIEINSRCAEAYICRARLYGESDRLGDALEDYKKVLTLEPAHKEANYAVQKLPPFIRERSENL